MSSDFKTVIKMFCLCLYWQHGFHYVFVMHITGTAYNTLNSYPSMGVNEYNCSQKQKCDPKRIFLFAALLIS